MSGRGGARRWQVAAVVAVVAALGGALAGCGGLPDSGPAGQGREVREVRGAPLRVVPLGPLGGADPVSIARGFLHAAAGFDNDHAIARQFLTATSSARWRPAQRTVIYPDDPSVTVRSRDSGDEREVVVTAPNWAVIDEGGRLALGEPGESTTVKFTMVRQGGQWRIDTLPQGYGLWMPRYDFERVYSPLRLGFAAVGTHVMVPDVRWFAGPRAVLPTAAVRALLAGPSDFLRGAVTTGAPPGTVLGVGAVPVADGLAHVDLSAQALSATVMERQRLRAQLTMTLRQLTTVTDVRVTVAGAAFAVAGDRTDPGQPLGYTDDVRVNGPVLVLSNGRLAYVRPSTGAVTNGSTQQFSRELDVRGLRSMAAGPESELLVGVDSDGTRLVSVTVDSPRQVLLRGRDLARPVIDGNGWTWVVDRRQGAVVTVTSARPSATSGPPTVQLRPAWLAGRQALSVDVSRDGARAAVVSVGADGSQRLDVAGVVRDVSGRPTALAAARAVGQTLGLVQDVAWADRTKLAVLAGPPGRVAPYAVEVGGLVTALPPVADARAIWAGDGLRAVYIVTSSGQVMGRTGNGWSRLGPGVAVTIPQ